MIQISRHLKDWFLSCLKHVFKHFREWDVFELITLFYEILLLSTKQNILNTEICKINNDFYLAKEKYYNHNLTQKTQWQ